MRLRLFQREDRGERVHIVGRAVLYWEVHITV
jgi:hypothetical protein